MKFAMFIAKVDSRQSIHRSVPPHSRPLPPTLHEVQRSAGNLDNDRRSACLQYAALFWVPLCGA